MYIANIACKYRKPKPDYISVPKLVSSSTSLLPQKKVLPTIQVHVTNERM